MAADFCVCVPARDEAARLPALLAALAGQDVTAPVPVVVALNNCTDHSWDLLAALRETYRHRLELTVDDVHFPPALAHAGSARRRAMELGAGRLGAHGILLTTDADARPPPAWLGANLRAIGNGLHIAGGRLVIDQDEALPPAVAVLQDRLARYWRLVRAIEDAVDPIAWDPPPRHGDHTGASLAVTCAAYRAAGGVPLLASGEDRALVRAVMRSGGRLGHPPDVRVHVSPRRVGRAAGGMAQAMRRLHEAAAAGTPLHMPDFRHWRARASWRRSIRDSHGTAAMLDLEDALPPMPRDLALHEVSLAEATAAA